MSAAERYHVSAADYLSREELAEEKSEYYFGTTFLMAGAKPDHVLVTGNLTAYSNMRLEGGNCRVYPSDLRVKAMAGNAYFYPDVTIICDKPALEADSKTVSNPSVIFEVLSQSTELRDRGLKFLSYSRLPSLKHYVLVDPDRPRVEVFTRKKKTKAKWDYEEIVGLQANVPLPEIGIELAMREIYRLVEFPEDAGPMLPAYDG